MIEAHLSIASASHGHLVHLDPSREPLYPVATWLFHPLARVLLSH